MKTLRIVDAAQTFFAKVHEIETAAPIIERLEGQKFQFILKDDEPLSLEISKGRTIARAGKSELTDKWVTTFRTDRETVIKLLNGTLRFGNAMVPIGRNIIVSEDNFIAKKHIISLLGQLIKLRQRALGRGAEAPTNLSNEIDCPG